LKIRFSGELFIYHVLIALGGGVFTAFLGSVPEITIHSLHINWPGARREGGSVSAAILDRLSNEAPGQFMRIEREVLIAFDLLLVVVLGLLLYSASARDPPSPSAIHSLCDRIVSPLNGLTTVSSTMSLMQNGRFGGFMRSAAGK
jgi:hypothetical protein